MLLADDFKKNNTSPKKICVGLQPSECKFNLYQRKNSMKEVTVYRKFRSLFTLLLVYTHKSFLRWEATAGTAKP